MEFIGFYAFVPTYDFSEMAESGNGFRIENDFMAWLGVMKRANYLLKLGLDLSDLEAKSRQLVEVVDAKVEEIDSLAPESGVREYMRHLSETYTELVFDPLDEIWEDELRRLLDKFDEEGEGDKG